MSFETYMVNRDESPAITFEGTFNNDHVGREMRDYAGEGFTLEPMGLTGVRVVFLYRGSTPWIYREFYAVEEETP